MPWQCICYVQNYVVITLLKLSWEQNKISIEVKLQWKQIQWAPGRLMCSYSLVPIVVPLITWSNMTWYCIQQCSYWIVWYKNKFGSQTFGNQLWWPFVHRLPKLVANISSHHLVNTWLDVGSFVKWLPIKVALTSKLDTIWVVYCSPTGNGALQWTCCSSYLNN